MNYNHFTVTHFKDGSVGANHKRDNWATITPFTAAIIIVLGGLRLFEATTSSTVDVCRQAPQ